MEGTEKNRITKRWSLYRVSFTMPDTAFALVRLLLMFLKLLAGFDHSALNGLKPK